MQKYLLENNDKSVLLVPQFPLFCFLNTTQNLMSYPLFWQQAGDLNWASHKWDSNKIHTIT